MSSETVRQQKIGCGCLCVAFLIFWCGWTCCNNACSYSPKPNENVGGAWVYAQFFVERELYAPKSADYPFAAASKGAVTPLGNDTYRVKSYVDASNRFGVKTHSDFSLTIKELPSEGKWKLEGQIYFSNRDVCLNAFPSISTGSFSDFDEPVVREHVSSDVLPATEKEPVETEPKTTKSNEEKPIEVLEGLRKRTWSSASGEYKSDAFLIFSSDDMGFVVLQGDDAKPISVPFENLSDEDQAYIWNLDETDERVLDVAEQKEIQDLLEQVAKIPTPKKTKPYLGLKFGEPIDVKSQKLEEIIPWEGFFSKEYSFKPESSSSLYSEIVAVTINGFLLKVSARYKTHTPTFLRNKAQSFREKYLLVSESEEEIVFYEGDDEKTGTRIRLLDNGTSLTVEYRNLSAASYYDEIKRLRDQFDESFTSRAKIRLYREEQILESERNRANQAQRQKDNEASTTKASPPASTDFDVESTKKEARRLFNELLGFRNKADFATYGFGVGGPYNRWLTDCQQLHKTIPTGAPRNSQEMTRFQLGVAVGQIEQLGFEYVSSHGKETEYSRITIPEIRDALK